MDWGAKVPKHVAIVCEFVHLCCMMRRHLLSLFLTFIAGMAAFSVGVLAQPQTTQQILSVLSANEAYPTGTYEVDYNMSDAEGYRHGLWIRVYDDGALYYRGLFEHGMPTGEWWFFRPDGTALSRMDQHPDSSRTHAFMFDAKGNIVATGGYLNPQLRLKAGALEERPAPPVKDGKWSFYNGKGRLASVVHYQAGIKHGLEETYRTNGRVLTTGNHVEGQKHGPWKRFTESGNLEELLTFKNGVLHGPAQAANRRGMPVSKGAYYEGDQDGTWTFYLDDGTLQEINRFVEGELTETIRVNGPFTDWYNPDRPAKEVHYKDRVKDGPFREWHDQGGYVIEEHIDAEMGGTVRRQVMKGLQISREGEYINGKLDGAVYHYDTSGRLVRTEHYDMGSLVKTDLR